VLAARFLDVAQSRLAIEGLQSAGIDGDDIILLSPFPEHPAVSPEAADSRIVRYLVRRVVIGILSGITIGVVLGTLVGALLVAATSPVEPLGEIVALASAGIVIGGPLGAYIGFERAGTLSDAWSTTFDELETGAVWIGVRIHDHDDRERAEHVFARVHPAELREL
jgi:hypothetical protein